LRGGRRGTGAQGRQQPRKRYSFHFQFSIPYQGAFRYFPSRIAILILPLEDRYGTAPLVQRITNWDVAAI
jgi:hypothetical protein